MTDSRKPIADEDFDAMIQSWLNFEHPQRLPDAKLTPDEVREWREAFEAAQCSFGDEPFDAAEMIAEQRR